MKVYIKEKQSIAMFKQKADSNFWDKHWEINNLRSHIVSSKFSDFILRPLKKYLPGEKGLILEGGCGRAQNVYCMKHNGYNAIGVDFATNTIEAVKEAVPELNVMVGDVRHLPFNDGEIAGYWSIGVIEYFWDGYDDILNEMARVIRNKGGFLFITFPYMSPLRKLKCLLGRYNTSFQYEDIRNFYQYCLDRQQVICDLAKRGFILRETIPFDGIKGFKDEASHCVLLIMEKVQNDIKRSD